MCVLVDVLGVVLLAGLASGLEDRAGAGFAVGCLDAAGLAAAWLAGWLEAVGALTFGLVGVGLLMDVLGGVLVVAGGFGADFCDTAF
jgi:hypothetical protein